MELTIKQALQQGIAAHKEGKLEEAERLYRAILQSQPAHPDANHNLGVIAVSVTKADVALPLFKTALEVNPKIEQFWLSYIDALIKEQQFENAKQVFEQAKTQGVAEEKLNALETQLTPTAQVNKPKLAVQNKSLSLSQKRKKLSEQKKRKKKAVKQNLKANNPSQQQLSSLLETYQSGRYGDAEKLALSITQEFPKHQFGWKVLGAVLEQTGRVIDSLTAMQKSVQLAPQDAAAHYNLGVTLRELGRLDEAEASCRQAIVFKPDFAEAHSNLGITLKELGRLEEAEASCRKAIVLKPDFAEAHTNLGITLKELDRFEEAEQSYTQVIALKPDYAEAHSNLGNTLKELGRLDEAEASYRQAIVLKSNYAGAHNNLGIMLYHSGRLEEAEVSYTQAIALKPNNQSYWNHIFFPVKAQQFSGSLNKGEVTSYKDALSADVLNNVYHDILEYRLAAFTPHLADDAFKKATNSLPLIIQEEISNPSSVSLNPQPSLPQKMIGLLHFGRSGTGLLHSLIDNHSEISTLPSIYFSEYFNGDSWKNLIANGWEDIAKRFVDQFEVLFDANSLIPVISSGETISGMGKHEGMTTVGPGRDEVLCVDRDRFCLQLRALMDCYPKLDPATFFSLVHIAYEATLDNPPDKDTIFYHIHNPNHYTALNFLRYRPDTRLVMMVRDPIQSCESWVTNIFDIKNLEKIHNSILVMLFDFDQIAFRTQDSIGVRLEDLKLHPKETLSALCDWMGVEEQDSLYEMTAQGKKWWGDPGSQDYSKEGMSPFDPASIKREVGSIFSDKDQFILRTLFYPFSVRFGYAEEDLAGFKKDLKEIDPLLDELFDFEEKLIQTTNSDLETFKKSGSYLYLRAGLRDRWNVLDEHNDYPHMLKPLQIDL